MSGRKIPVTGWRLGLLFGALSVALSGCIAERLMIRLPLPSSQQSSQQQTTAPATAPTTAAVGGDAVASSPVRPRPVIAVVAGEPPLAGSNAADLVGRFASKVLDLLGEPAFRRHEGTAHIWRYDSAQCQLHVMLSGAGEAAQVSHLEFRHAEAGSVDQETCFKGLLKQVKSS